MSSSHARHRLLRRSAFVAIFFGLSLALPSHDWIEQLGGPDFDHGSGSIELYLVCLLIVGGLTLLALEIRWAARSRASTKPSPSPRS